MTRSLEEITAALDPDSVRQALQKQLTNVKTLLADNVVSLQVEVPTLRPDVRSEIEGNLKREIARLDGIRADIEERLSSSENALKGLVKVGKNGT